MVTVLAQEFQLKGAFDVEGVTWLPACALLLVGCQGPQSALAPAGRGAEAIAELFWWMAVGSLVIWVIVIGLSIYAIYVAPGRHKPWAAKLLIVGGGFVFPTVVLAVLLSYGLALLPPLLAPPRPGALKIRVSGEQWWWRVRYYSEAGQAIHLANEIRLPVGQPVEFELESPDVIHSFWIPALGGKVDMIPGRTTRLTLEPTQTGTFRGACAEYCGTSHAWMSFSVIVLKEKDFAHWLARQAEPRSPPPNALASRGEAIFLASGCGACHAVRGTQADGVVGPDLTHVGSRLSLGAGRLGNQADDFARWIAHTERLKPAVLMPTFDMLSREELDALGAYLDGLR
jgi:cytochrome c oxidase subunit 2